MKKHTRAQSNTSRQQGSFSRSHRTFAVALSLISMTEVSAQTSSTAEVNNESRPSRGYESSQKFSGTVFRKDNNLWMVTKEFAELFRMPQEYIGDVKGIAAAAFRIEDTSTQECGFFGRADACRSVHECILDLYFDESDTPLPWATDVKSQWRPSAASVIWLQPLNWNERPHGILAVDPPAGILRNKLIHSTFIPFADPRSKLEAIFTTNARTDRGGEDAVSGFFPVRGYTRDFYRNLSIVSLQFGCQGASRENVDIRLDAVSDGIFGYPIARFNRIFLPKDFTKMIGERIAADNKQNPIPIGSRLPQSKVQ